VREIWRALIREHARAYQQELALLGRDLEPFAHPVGADVVQPGADPTVAAPPSTLDAWRRFTRLLDANRRLERAIQHAFAIQSDASGDVDDVESGAFWELVDLCQALAAQISRDPLVPALP
jgi:hypothetical protein